MKSSKFEYRITTHHKGGFGVQCKSLSYPESEWFGLLPLPFQTTRDAKDFIENQIAADDFVPQVIPMEATNAA